MKSPRLSANVRPFRLTPKLAQERIHRIAQESDRIKWSRHALERMAEREILDVVALRVLRTGFICGQPEAGQNVGEWKCKMTLKIRGAREVGVIAIILMGDCLFVKTVEWEDLP